METSWAKKDDKEDQCASRVEDSSNTNQCAVDGDLRFILKLDHLLLHLVNGLLWKTNDESGTPRSQSGWKTSWAKKDDKEDQCASRVEDSSNTNQWGKKEAGSSPSSSGVGLTSGIKARALRNFDLEVMELENTQNNALAKLPMLKLREYEMWEIRIKQYFQIQDYALWEVIENGNSWVPIPVTTPSETGTSTATKMIIPSTIE
ncbi:hypothetical protein Tco_0843611 [Tanacetum coccineum]|uniref:Uncharacterized protein n=1 Tax=Tanacetum coccineum TaxID=301880 RepID=A0ABQ5B6U5_9ASTR